MPTMGAARSASGGRLRAGRAQAIARALPFGPDYGLPLMGQANEFVVTRSVRDAAALLDAWRAASRRDVQHQAPARPTPCRSAGRGTVSSIAVTDRLPGSDRSRSGLPGGAATNHPDPDRPGPLGRDRCAVTRRPEQFHSANVMIWSSFHWPRQPSAPPRRWAEITTRTGGGLHPRLHRLGGASADHCSWSRPLAAMNSVSRQVATFYGKYDRSPPCARRPRPSATSTRAIHVWTPVAGTTASSTSVPSTALFNFTGLPAISLPLGMAGELPSAYISRRRWAGRGTCCSAGCRTGERHALASAHLRRSCVQAGRRLTCTSKTGISSATPVSTRAWPRRSPTGSTPALIEELPGTSGRPQRYPGAGPQLRFRRGPVPQIGIATAGPFDLPHRAPDRAARPARRAGRRHPLRQHGRGVPRGPSQASVADFRPQRGNHGKRPHLWLLRSPRCVPANGSTSWSAPRARPEWRPSLSPDPHGDEHPDGQAIWTPPVASPLDGALAVGHQVAQVEQLRPGCRPDRAAGPGGLQRLPSSGRPPR